MKRCRRCDGFVPEGALRCPNCRALPRWWALSLVAAGAGLALVTLSACYGPAPGARWPEREPASRSGGTPAGSVDAPDAGR